MVRRGWLGSSRMIGNFGRNTGMGGTEGGGRNRDSGWRRGLLRSFMTVLLSMAMLLGTWTGALAATDEAQATAASAPTHEQVHNAKKSLQASLARTEPLSDWIALALARGGAPAPNRYAAQLARIAPDSFRLVTDYARVALAVSAHGWDARKAGPNQIDLLGKIAKFEDLTKQGPNGPAYALMALDAGDYKAKPGDRWTRESLIRWLLDHRGEGGGWSLAAGKSEVDLTGIVLTALAPYKDRENVEAAIEGALDWLSSVQNEQGGFGGVGSAESSESSAQVVIALTALDIDPGLDARFVKNGKSVLARLLEFRQADGSFAHLPGGKSDGLASMFALLSLTAADRWQEGLPGLFRGNQVGEPIPVTVYGPEGRLAQGSGTGRTPLEDLTQALQASNVSYEVERHPQFGPYLTKIGSIGNGQYGGFDGWQYAVKKDGAWAHDLTGMSAYEMKGAQELVVYYGESPALIHDVRLEPASLREGRNVTVTIRQETFDWETGKAVIGPAAGANVSIGGATAVTDRDGKAELTGLAAGKQTLLVDGYRQGAAPAFVSYEQFVDVQRYVKNATVRVEGDQGLIAEGAARGGTALEALEALLKARKIPYEVKELSFGKYVASIDGVEAGKYGGMDGWLFAISGEEGSPSWIYPMEGIGTYLLEEDQQVVVYYGDNTILPESVTVGPAVASTDDTITVKVNYREMNWETGELGTPKPLAGAQVTAGGKSAVTDALGQVKLDGLPEGVHEVVVTGYSEEHAPSVLRTASRVSVAGPYSDENAIAGWASIWVREARAAGVLRGEGDQASSEAAFDPKRGIARGEFVAALVRAIGVKPVAAAEEPAFRDVAADAWYAGEIEAAAQAGLIAGVAPGKFAPDSLLTREQAAQLLTRALKIEAQEDETFADAEQVSPGAMAAVQAVLRQGWMTLQDDGAFLPKSMVTREQAAVIAVRLLHEHK